MLGPRTRICNKDGFYEHKIDGVSRVLINTEIEKHKKALGANININNRYRLIPCYADVKDKNTIEWHLFYCVAVKD